MRRRSIITWGLSIVFLLLLIVLFLGIGTSFRLRGQLVTQPDWYCNLLPGGCGASSSATSVSLPPIYPDNTNYPCNIMPWLCFGTQSSAQSTMPYVFPYPSSTSSSGNIPIGPTTDLAVSATVRESANLRKGSLATIDLTVINTGSSPARNIHVTGTLPGTYQLFNSLSPNEPFSSGCTFNELTFDCVIPSLASFATANRVLSFDIPLIFQQGTCPGSIAVPIRVHSDIADSFIGNDTAVATLAPQCTGGSSIRSALSSRASSAIALYSDIDVHFRQNSPRIVRPNSVVRLLYEVTNTGNAAAHNVIVSHLIPVGFQANLSFSSSYCGVQGNSVRCSLPPISPNVSIPVDIGFSVGSALACPQMLSGLVSVTTSSFEINTLNNLNPESLNVQCTQSSSAASLANVDISLIQRANFPYELIKDVPTRLLYLVRNTGNAVAQNVVVTQQVPEGAVADIRFSSTFCTVVQHTVRCVIPSLGLGAAQQVDVGIRYTSSYCAPTVAHNVSVESTLDGNPSNNTITGFFTMSCQTSSAFSSRQSSITAVSSSYSLVSSRLNVSSAPLISSAFNCYYRCAPGLEITNIVCSGRRLSGLFCPPNGCVGDAEMNYINNFCQPISVSSIPVSSAGTHSSQPLSSSRSSVVSGQTDLSVRLTSTTDRVEGGTTVYTHLFTIRNNGQRSAERPAIALTASNIVDIPNVASGGLPDCTTSTANGYITHTCSRQEPLLPGNELTVSVEVRAVNTQAFVQCPQPVQLRSQVSFAGATDTQSNNDIAYANMSFPCVSSSSSNSNNNSSVAVGKKRVIVTFNSFDVQALRNLAFPGAGASYNALQLQTAPQLRRLYSISPIAVVDLPQGEVEAYSRLEGVTSVVEDYQVRINLNQSVPLIHATEVLQEYTNLQPVKVCIIDSGMNLNHASLPRVVEQIDFVEGDNIADDDNGHGTHVAGIIGSTNTQYKGVAPNVQLYLAKTQDGAGYGTASNIMAAIEWCSQRGVKVMNMSLGGGQFNGACDNDPMANVANAATRNGSLVIAASGNDGWSQQMGSPACGSNTMAVGATDKNKNPAGYSNAGSMLDIVAPGTDIVSAYGNGFGQLTGTSMAAPHVTGAAAVLFGIKPTLSTSELWDLLRYNADDLQPAGHDFKTGFGFLNLKAAADKIRPASSATSSVVSTSQGTSNQASSTQQSNQSSGGNSQNSQSSQQVSSVTLSVSSRAFSYSSVPNNCPAGQMPCAIGHYYECWDPAQYAYVRGPQCLTGCVPIAKQCIEIEPPCAIRCEVGEEYECTSVIGSKNTFRCNELCSLPQQNWTCVLPDQGSSSRSVARCSGSDRVMCEPGFDYLCTRVDGFQYRTYCTTPTCLNETNCSIEGRRCSNGTRCIEGRNYTCRASIGAPNARVNCGNGCMSDIYSDCLLLEEPSQCQFGIDKGQCRPGESVSCPGQRSFACPATGCYDKAVDCQNVSTCPAQYQCVPGLGFNCSATVGIRCPATGCAQVVCSNYSQTATLNAKPQTIEIPSAGVCGNFHECSFGGRYLCNGQEMACFRPAESESDSITQNYCSTCPLTSTFALKVGQCINSDTNSVFAACTVGTRSQYSEYRGSMRCIGYNECVSACQTSRMGEICYPVSSIFSPSLLAANALIPAAGLAGIAVLCGLGVLILQKKER